MKNTAKKKKIIAGILFGLAYAAVFLPYLISIFYALPASDDFSMAAGIDATDRIASSAKMATHLYMNFGGGIWIAKFFESLLNPIVAHPIDGPALGITLFLFFALFLIALNLFFRTLFTVELRIKDGVLKEGLVFCMTALPFCGHVYSEAFYWFSGSPYVWFMSLLFLFGILEMNYYASGKKGYRYAATAVGTVCCMNIPYTVPVILTYLFLQLRHKKGEEKFFTVKRFIPVLLFACGALVYLLAPGVRERSVSIGTNNLTIASLLRAVGYAVKTLIIRAGSICLSGAVQVVLLFAVFGLGTMVETENGEIRPKMLLFFVIMLVLVLLGAVYPVVLGYGSSGIPDRVCFVTDILMLTLLSTFCFLLGQYAKSTLKIQWNGFRYLAAVVFFAGLLYGSAVSNGKLLEAAPVKITVRMGQIMEEHNEWMNILTGIRDSEEDDVRIVHGEIPESQVLKTPDILEDKTWWVNGAAARYFGKKSVVMVWAD